MLVDAAIIGTLSIVQRTIERNAREHRVTSMTLMTLTVVTAITMTRLRRGVETRRTDHEGTIQNPNEQTSVSHFH